MTISGDGGVPVSGPACRPTRYGLRSAADVSPGGDDWLKGLEWDELPCGDALGVVAGQCPPLPEHRKTSVQGFGTKYADPFAVYAGWDCSTGGLLLSKAWDNAETLLDRGWWHRLERTFWTGLDQDDNTVRETLGTAEVEDLTPAGGALDITSGLAALESFAGDCFDCEPIVHGNRGLAAYFADRHLIQRDGEHTRALGTGTVMVFGGGYDDSGPRFDPEDPESAQVPAVGEAWIYVTGGVGITHGTTIFTPERGDAGGAVDRLVNNITVYAERYAAFQVGCCVGAVRVLLGGAGCECPNFTEESS